MSECVCGYMYECVWLLRILNMFDIGHNAKLRSHMLGTSLMGSSTLRPDTPLVHAYHA